MTSTGQISDSEESDETYIFGKHMTRAIQFFLIIYFGQVKIV